MTTPPAPAARSFWDRYATDPAFAELIDEEARSIAESVGYVIRTSSIAARPEPCESCGTRVTACLEAKAGPAPDTWRAAGWELGSNAYGSRHTARRCDWLTAHPGALTAEAAA